METIVAERSVSSVFWPAFSVGCFLAVAGHFWIARRRGLALLAVAFVCGLMWASSARAAAPQTMYRYVINGWTWQTSWSLACSTLPATSGSTSFRYAPNADGIRCDQVYVTPTNLAGVVYQSYTGNTSTLCLDGSSPDTTKPLAQQCADPPPTCSIAAGTVIPGDHYTIVSDTKLAAGLDFCTPATNCSLTASGRTGGKNLTTGKWEYQFMGPLKANGTVCTTNGTGASEPVKDQPIKCAAGMCTGTVNGVEICVKCVETDNSTAGKTTTTNADGSTSNVSTTTSVTCDNNSCTTTNNITTTTTPAGGGTPTTQNKADSSTESKDSYCSKNPTVAVCKESKSSFAGSCDSSFACDGDAVQCAIAKEQYKRNCEIEKSPFAEAMRVRAEGVSWDMPQAEKDAINLNGAKNIKVDEKWQLNMTTVAQRLTTAGGATCPTGQGVDFFAQHVEISYEIPCRFATVIRAFVTLAAAFVAFRIFAAG